MSVLLIVGHIDFKGCGLCAAPRGDTLRCRLLLRNDRLQFQFSELHIRPDAEQRRGALDKRIVRGECHIASLHQFDDFIFLAVVLQLQVLGVEVEGGIGIVVQVHVDLVAHLTIDAQVDFFIEVESRRLAVADRQRRIVDALQRGTDFQFGRALCLHPHTARSEDFLGRSKVELHISEVKLLLTFCLVILCILLSEELLPGTPFAPLHIFFGCHEDGGVQIRVAHLRAEDIDAQRVVVDWFDLQIVGHAQVECTRVQVRRHDGGSLLNFPTRVQERVGNLVFIDFQCLWLGLDLRPTPSPSLLREGSSCLSKQLCRPDEKEE